MSYDVPHEDLYPLATREEAIPAKPGAKAAPDTAPRTRTVTVEDWKALGQKIVVRRTMSIGISMDIEDATYVTYTPDQLRGLNEAQLGRLKVRDDRGYFRSTLESMVLDWVWYLPPSAEDTAAGRTHGDPIPYAREKVMELPRWVATWLVGQIEVRSRGLDADKSGDGRADGDGDLR